MGGGGRCGGRAALGAEFGPEGAGGRGAAGKVSRGLRAWHRHLVGLAVSRGPLGARHGGDRAPCPSGPSRTLGTECPFLCWIWNGLRGNRTFSLAGSRPAANRETLAGHTEGRASGPHIGSGGLGLEDWHGLWRLQGCLEQEGLSRRALEGQKGKAQVGTGPVRDQAGVRKGHVRVPRPGETRLRPGRASAQQLPRARLSPRGLRAWRGAPGGILVGRAGAGLWARAAQMGFLRCAPPCARSGHCVGAGFLV